MPAVGTKFPELEVIHIRKGPAAGTADDEVHVIMVPSSDLYKYISALSKDSPPTQPTPQDIVSVLKRLRVNRN
jgi:hypothetical protein